MVEAALTLAERRGYRLALFGRTGALTAISLFYLMTLPLTADGPLFGLVLLILGLGIAPLLVAGTRFGGAARYAFFAVDAAAIAASIAVAPVSSAGDIPQNFVFLSDRQVYFYVLLAASLLTLSPGLVLWTGLCCVTGLTAATVWIMNGMERVVSYRDLPEAPSRSEYLEVVFDPNFLNIPIRISEVLVLALVTAVAALAVNRARAVVRAQATAEEKRGHILRLFGRYVPAPVAGQLAEDGHLAPQMREASVLFADIEGFTALAEHLSPARVIGLLDSFFDAATQVIDREGGVVINYIGDALIAAFNAPLPVDGFPERAMRAAEALQAVAASRTFEGHRLRIRIGIATGPVAAGTVGGDQHQSYTVYGDTVNLAQRLERLNKKLGTNCLMCGETAKRSSLGSVESIGAVRVRGRIGPVQVFAIRPAQQPALQLGTTHS
jgi:class 3 adenylate cyclase